MIYVRGTLLGLGLFAAWVAAMALIVFAVFTIEYWVWAIFPGAFIALGISIARDRAKSNG